MAVICPPGSMSSPATCSANNTCPALRLLLLNGLLCVCSLTVICSAFLINNIITGGSNCGRCTVTFPSSLENGLRANMAATDVQVGPWGGNGGNPWKFIPDGKLLQIHIRSGGCIDSIGFTYMDHEHVIRHSKIYGGSGGIPQTITFAEDEDLVGISGTVGECCGNMVITSLSFRTNKKNHGPYGTIQGTSFSLPVPKGRFSGFIGNHGGHLDSFGVVLHLY